MGAAIACVVCVWAAFHPPTERDERMRLARQLQRIIENQRAIGTGLGKQLADLQHRRLIVPKLTAPPEVTLKSGESKSVMIRIDWQLFKNSELSVKVETSDATVARAAAEIDVKEEQSPDAFSLKLTAGAKAGVATIRLQPASGSPVELRAVVK